MIISCDLQRNNVIKIHDNSADSARRTMMHETGTKAQQSSANRFQEWNSTGKRHKYQEVNIDLIAFEDWALEFLAIQEEKVLNVRSCHRLVVLKDAERRFSSSCENYKLVVLTATWTSRSIHILYRNVNCTWIVVVAKMPHHFM